MEIYTETMLKGEIKTIGEAKCIHQHNWQTAYVQGLLYGLNWDDAVTDSELKRMKKEMDKASERFWDRVRENTKNTMRVSDYQIIP